LWGSRRTSILNIPLDQTDPDKWMMLRFLANSPGSKQVGMAVRNKADDEFAISKTMFVNIQDD
jgi:hypothetical protein